VKRVESWEGPDIIRYLQQVAVNIGMVTGVRPVVGVTLPLISYGGSSALTVMIALGLVMNVSVRRFAY
jgi:rod shape determining protein RodA